jgi:hypothetical protein
VRRRYPLEALKAVRQSAVDAQVREVAERAAGTAEARAEEERARRRRQAEEERARGSRNAESTRVDRGDARVADLQAQATWELAERERIEALQRRERAIAETADVAAGLEQSARADLARAQAEVKAVERHRERWSSEGERAAELETEDAAQDVWAARRAGPGRRA